MEYMATMLKTTLLPMYLVPTDWIRNGMGEIDLEI